MLIVSLNLENKFELHFCRQRQKKKRDFVTIEVCLFFAVFLLFCSLNTLPIALKRSYISPVGLFYVIFHEVIAF